MAQQLTPRHEALIEQIVALAQHADADEVIDEAFQLLDERTRRLRWLRAELRVALDQEVRGDLIDYTPATMERLIAEAEERSRRGLPVRDAVKPTGPLQPRSGSGPDGDPPTYPREVGEAAATGLRRDA